MKPVPPEFLKLKCPVCGAEPGEMCTITIPRPHSARRPVSPISSRSSKMPFLKQYKNAVSIPTRVLVMQMREQGASYEAIGRKVGRCVTRVSQIWRQTARLVLFWRRPSGDKYDYGIPQDFKTTADEVRQAWEWRMQLNQYQWQQIRQCKP